MKWSNSILTFALFSANSQHCQNWSCNKFCTRSVYLVCPKIKTMSHQGSVTLIEYNIRCALEQCIVIEYDECSAPNKGHLLNTLHWESLHSVYISAGDRIRYEPPPLGQSLYIDHSTPFAFLYSRQQPLRFDGLTYGSNQPLFHQDIQNRTSKARSSQYRNMESLRDHLRVRTFSCASLPSYNTCYYQPFCA